jgi:stalled ribosome alternative rescue factor ArfA
MEQAVMARGFKNPNNSSLGSRNPLAKQIRKPPWRTRVIRCRKGKGSYFRKGRSKRSFFYFYFTHAVNLVIGRVIISYDKNRNRKNFPKLTEVKSPVLSLSVKQKP